MPSADPSSVSSSVAPPKPFSISLFSKPKSGKFAPTAGPASTPSALSLATRKRPHSALADPDSEPEDDSVANGHEAVVGFGDDGKAISVADESNKKRPLVIKSKGNKDWREEIRRKRGKNLLPAELQAQQQQQDGQGESASTVEQSEVSMEGGLKIVQAKKVDEDGDVLMNGTQMNGEGSNGGKRLTADEEAIAALLGDEKKKSTLTIPSAEDKASDTNGHKPDPDDYADEAHRFRADVDSRPPPASLEDYAAVPVEEFGAAILRGLGWKDGEAIDKRGQAAAAPREVKRRPALLGIGAKETPGGVAAEELGAWNQKKGRRKEKVAYNPVMLRNKATGEMVTEEEMELRKLEEKQGKGNALKEEDWRERRMKNLRIDEGRREGRLAIENGDESYRNGGGGNEITVLRGGKGQEVGVGKGPTMGALDEKEAGLRSKTIGRAIVTIEIIDTRIEIEILAHEKSIGSMKEVMHMGIMTGGIEIVRTNVGDDVVGVERYHVDRPMEIHEYAEYILGFQKGSQRNLIRSLK